MDICPQEPNEAGARDKSVGPLITSQIWRVVRSGIWLEPGTRHFVDGDTEHTVQEITQVISERLKELQLIQSRTLIELCTVGGKDETNDSVMELESLLAALESLSSPWRKLPPELLVEVFSWCIPFQDVLSTSSAPLLLTRICSRWYNLSVNSPSLWTSIILAENFLVNQVHLRSAINFEDKWRGINSFDFDIKEADFISRILSRSRTLPLSLSTHTILFQYPQASNLLHELVSRSKHLALLFPEPKGPHWSSVPVTSIPLTAPFLESLDLYAPQVRGTSQDPHWVLPFISLIQSSLQTLKRLTVITSAPMWPFTESGLSWYSITHITWMPVILASDVIDLLRSAPNLVHACFPNTFDGSIRPPLPEPVSLRYLETLVTRAEGMFDSITLPNLHHLVLLQSSDWEKDALVAFFQRSACLLETLYMYGAAYNEPRALLQILETVEGGSSALSSDERRAGEGRRHLKALLIADHHENNLFSDEFMDRLTWVPESRQGDMVLFPGLEYLSLYNIAPSAAEKLAALLLSRSFDVRSAVDEIHTSTHPMKLKVFETWHPDAHLNFFGPMDWDAIEDLREEGLVLRIFKTGDSKPCFTDGEKVVLRRYVEEEGLVVRDYLHDIGQFAPIVLREELD